MFVQLNPDLESYLETISTLKFAERVSGVELGAARSNKEGRGLRELMEQVLLVVFLFRSFGYKSNLCFLFCMWLKSATFFISTISIQEKDL